MGHYYPDAKNAIEEIISKGKTPIVVGGTGLYIDSLIYEIEYSNIEIDEDYRKELEKIKEKEGLEVLYKKALEIDSKAMEKISLNDSKRIMRVLEIYNSTGNPSIFKSKLSLNEPFLLLYKVLKISLSI
jgi:tRNA dimethylallyltransferase